MINTQTNKQANKETNNKKSSHINRLGNKKMYMTIVLIQSNEKALMKFAPMYARMKPVKCLSKNLFNIDIINTYYTYMYTYIYMYIDR